MSIRAMAWAWDQKCPSAVSKLVLIKLADHADDDGKCWPSQGRIAADCGVTRQHVNAQIKVLTKLGLLETEARLNGNGQHTNLYFLRCKPGLHPPVSGLTPPASPVDTPPASPVDTEPSFLEPSIEPYPPTPPAGGDAGFAIWYAVYPHKVGKAAALKAFKTVRKRTPLEALIQGVHRYVASKPPDRPWCNPATWLNQQRWLDQPAPLLAGIESVAKADRAPPPPMDPKKLGHSLPCHCANCLRWVEEASHAAA